MTPTVKIERMLESTQPQIGGAFTAIYRVTWTFTVGDGRVHGPFYDTFPVEGFNPLAAKQQLTARAQQLVAVGLG